MKFSRADRELKTRAAQALVDAGWTGAQAMRAVGYSATHFVQLGVAVKKNPTASRNARMVTLYQEGKTLEEIGLAFDITRERVRQILARSGLSRTNGGAFYKKGRRDVANRERARAVRDARAQNLFGCGWDIAVALNNDSYQFRTPGKPAAAYLTQKKDADVRNIPWEMTFPEWVAIWTESGKWHQRGRGKGRYCMSRKADAGPYSPENVRIISNEENIAEGFAVNPAARRFGKPIAQKRERQARCLELRQQGKTHKEIAAILGIAANTSAQYCVNAKRLVQGAV